MIAGFSRVHPAAEFRGARLKKRSTSGATISTADPEEMSSSARVSKNSLISPSFSSAMSPKAIRTRGADGYSEMRGDGKRRALTSDAAFI